MVVLTLFPAVSNGQGYETHIRLFLTKYCVGCHGPSKQKADLRVDKLDPDMVLGSDTDMWQEVLDLINVSEMPPKEAKAQPKRAERQVIVETLTASLRQAMEPTEPLR
jgi:mono/diheme cytochrome c family protein